MVAQNATQIVILLVKSTLTMCRKNEQRKKQIAEYMRGENEYVDYMHNRSRAKDKKRKFNL